MRFILLGSILICTVAAHSQCLDKQKNQVEIDNQVAAAILQNGKDLQKERSHVKGKVTDVYRDRNSHKHFSIALNGNQRIEVVFSSLFGAPTPRVGDTVEACGDLIVTKKNSYQYLKSPDGGIIHWVHKATNGTHPSGYIKVNGKKYGDREGSLPPPVLRLDQIRQKDGSFKSVGTPEAKCFRTDARGIVLNPGHLHMPEKPYGFLFDGRNIYSVASKADSEPRFVTQTDSMHRFFRENLRRLEYDQCGFEGAKQNNLSFDEIAAKNPNHEFNLEKDQTDSKILPQCARDSRGIIMNPNRGRSAAPYSTFYGFAVDKEGRVYKMKTENDTSLPLVTEQLPIEDFLTNIVQVDAAGNCRKSLDQEKWPEQTAKGQQ